MSIEENDGNYVIKEAQTKHEYTNMYTTKYIKKMKNQINKLDFRVVDHNRKSPSSLFKDIEIVPPGSTSAAKRFNRAYGREKEK